MGVIKSVVRFVTTLGGLLSSKIDRGTDALTTTPDGIKAAYSTTRGEWKKQYRELRDAVSQLITIMEQKRNEIQSLQQEQTKLEQMKRGAVEKFRQTRDEQYQTAFSECHEKLKKIDARLGQLQVEVEEMEKQHERHKMRLIEMKEQIDDLDKQEAEAIADIVTSKQIIELNDRMANLGTSLHDENLQAIQKMRSRMKATAKLSDELAGTDKALIEKEIREAGMTSEAMDEFASLLAESELKGRERPENAGPQTDRSM